MNSFEISEIVNQYGITVCATDELAIFSNTSGMYIVNTDYSWNEGKHWVAFNFPSHGPCEFFDSLGREPEYYHLEFENILMLNGPEYLALLTPIQADDSTLCGQYCIYYTLSRVGGLSMPDIMSTFTENDTRGNDVKMNTFINKLKT